MGVERAAGAVGDGIAKRDDRAPDADEPTRRRSPSATTATSSSRKRRAAFFGHHVAAAVGAPVRRGDRARVLARPHVRSRNVKAHREILLRQHRQSARDRSRALPPAGIATVRLPVERQADCDPAAVRLPELDGRRTRVPIVTGSVPKVLSRRMRTPSPGIVTLAIMRTVAFVICVSPSACCEVPQRGHPRRAARPRDEREPLQVRLIPAWRKRQCVRDGRRMALVTTTRAEVVARRPAIFIGSRLLQKRSSPMPHDCGSLARRRRRCQPVLYECFRRDNGAGQVSRT